MDPLFPIGSVCRLFGITPGHPAPLREKGLLTPVTDPPLPLPLLHPGPSGPHRGHSPRPGHGHPPGPAGLGHGPGEPGGLRGPAGCPAPNPPGEDPGPGGGSSGRPTAAWPPSGNSRPSPSRPSPSPGRGRPSTSTRWRWTSSSACLPTHPRPRGWTGWRPGGASFPARLGAVREDETVTAFSFPRPPSPPSWRRSSSSWWTWALQGP